MAVPKRRVSHARTHNRKAHWLGDLSMPSTGTCPHCGEPVLSYRACRACGHYRGSKVAEGKEEA